MRIALLDDDVDYGRLVAQWLNGGGHSCEYFPGSRQFLKTIERDTFDLFILDWLLPEIDGIEVLYVLRERLQSCAPILFVTVVSGEENIVKALLLGADDYMVKPVGKRELLARVTALGRRMSRGQLNKETLEFPPFTLAVCRT